jgi:hypothetical protein
MLSSCQKAIRLTALSRAGSDSASSEEPGMRVRLADGNREISGSPLPAGQWAAGGRRMRLSLR